MPACESPTVHWRRVYADLVARQSVDNLSHNKALLMNFSATLYYFGQQFLAAAHNCINFPQ
jgi:hypothetical protein